MIQITKEYSKAALLMYLYNIPLAKLAEVYGTDERKYTSLMNGKYKRIDRESLRELCSFLNVSVENVLSSLYEGKLCRVYIDNLDYWMEFDLYIYLRAHRVIIDEFYEGMKSITHNLNTDLASIDEFNQKGTNYLIELTRNLFLEYPINFRIHYEKYYYYYSYKFEEYEKLIKPYLAKYVDADEIIKKAEIEEKRRYDEVFRPLLERLMKRKERIKKQNS